MHVEIPLQGSHLVALVDAADADLVAGFVWRPLQTDNDQLIYAHAWRKNLHVYMHRLVSGAGPNDRVDHVNRNGLDNRSVNLRLATPSQNGANRSADRRSAGKTSHYKGVCWDKSRNKWAAHIHVDGRSRYVGRFDNEDAAARAYDVAAREAWGDFARLNFTD